MRMDKTIYGSQELTGDAAAALRIGVSERFHARSLHRRLQGRADRARERHAHCSERQSVAIAMLAVEEQIVKALWTIALQPLGQAAPLASSRCGIDYAHEPSDIHSIYADAAGGKWNSIAPRAPVPSAKDISHADRVQKWLLLIDDEGLRKMLVIGATSKRGDAARRIPWVLLKVPQRFGITSRTCQRRYDEALRIIADALTLARMG